MNPQSEGENSPEAGSARPRRLPTHRVPMWLRIVLTVAVLVPVLWFFVIPQFSDAEESFKAVQDVSPWLIAGALVLQVLLLVSYSALSGTVLGWGKLRLRTLLRIDLSDLAINHTLSGGGATAAVARFAAVLERRLPFVGNRLSGLVRSIADDLRTLGRDRLRLACLPYYLRSAIGYLVPPRCG